MSALACHMVLRMKYLKQSEGLMDLKAKVLPQVMPSGQATARRRKRPLHAQADIRVLASGRYGGRTWKQTGADVYEDNDNSHGEPLLATSQEDCLCQKRRSEKIWCADGWQRDMRDHMSKRLCRTNYNTSNVFRRWLPWLLAGARLACTPSTLDMWCCAFSEHAQDLRSQVLAKGILCNKPNTS